MNKLEKILVWTFGWKYTEQDEVTVDIMHLRSSKKKVYGLQKTFTKNWVISPLKITRPKIGRMKLEYGCPHCGKRLLFNVTSRNTLKKIIKITGIAGGIALTALVLTILFGINSIVSGFIIFPAIAILTLAVIILAIVLPMEYKQNGIGFGIRDYPSHQIKYSSELDILHKPIFPRK